MAAPVIPHYLDEEKFFVGRGLRSLRGYYCEFTSASYIAGLLSEKVDSLKGLEKKLALDEAIKINNIAVQVKISGNGAHGSPLFSASLLNAHGYLDPEEKGYLIKLSRTLQQSQEDFSSFAQKIATLWGAFYHHQPSEKMQDIYEFADMVLHRAVLQKEIGHVREYKRSLEQLDEICSQVEDLPRRKKAKKK